MDSPAAVASVSMVDLLYHYVAYALVISDMPGWIRPQTYKAVTCESPISNPCRQCVQIPLLEGFS